VLKVVKGFSAVTKMDSQQGGTLPRHFDILRAKVPTDAFDLMTDAYLQSVTTQSPQPQRSVALPPVRSDSTMANRDQKLSLAGHVSSISNSMQLLKNFHQTSSLRPSSANPVVKNTGLHDKHFAEHVRDQVLIEICHSVGLADAVLDPMGDTLTSLVLQVPKSFRENSVNAMQIQPSKHDSAAAKAITEKHMNQGVAASPKISGQKVPFPSDFLKPLDFDSEPMNPLELDDPTILLLQGSEIALVHEVLLPDGCTIIQKLRKDGKIDIRINLSMLPVSRSEAQKSLDWFLNQWKKLENFDMNCSLSNVQTAWAVLSVSFMDVTRQSFLICKERGVHLQHLWLHLSSFACRGITLAQTIATNFAAAEVKYLHKISEFEANFTSEVDKLHKFYQKQLNLTWITEERYKLIIMGLEKEKEDLVTQLRAVSDSAIYNELVSLRTFYMNFAENTRFLRDLVIDATSDWSKRASNNEKRWKAKAAGEVENVEKMALTIGESDQQEWELKMNEIYLLRETSHQECVFLKESNDALTAEVTSLREQLEQYCFCKNLFDLSSPNLFAQGSISSEAIQIGSINIRL
jgi:hypothetical protein